MFKNLSNKKKITLMVLGVVSFISFIWLVTRSKNPEEVIVKATPLPVKFTFIKAIPASESISTIPVTSNVEFYFSKPIEEATADVVISPNVPLSFSSDFKNSSFNIRAIPSWEVGKEYKIKLKIKSKEGESLESEINYSFELTKMKDSLLTE